MEETDIIICLKKHLKNIFHRCRRSINIKDTGNKGAFQNCYYKDIFISASINF